MVALDQYATLPELRRLDGLADAELITDTDLSEALSYAVETVEGYTGQEWPERPPTAIRWAVRTIARQWAVDLHSRMPDRALSINSEFGQVSLAQAGGDWRPTSLPEVNAVLNRYRSRPPWG
ncbi:hypothetical protein [Amycolatopsis sp. lyj-23]|uniref:hypothetical protein n=1 Tax=Amycolatopsis sp. lyj-23 TaxID=2789283 RepID=UPI00397963FE